VSSQYLKRAPMGPEGISVLLLEAGGLADSRERRQCRGLVHLSGQCRGRLIEDPD
jgi:hypothetical protein